MTEPAPDRETMPVRASAGAGPLPAGQHRSALVAEVRARLHALTPHRAVIVACSGGPDSAALAHLASEARPDVPLVLVHVAHGLRGRAADLADRDVVMTHARWLGAGFVGRDVEVAPAGRGLEAAARDVRYAALRAAVVDENADAILVGHTADDQAETVLLRLARGTGTDGLAAMAAVSGDLLRPLLRLRRVDVHGFVAGEGLPVAIDASNEDLAIRRVRVRREVLPALAQVGADPVGTLARLADLARDDAEALTAAAAALPAAIRRVGPVVALRSEVLAAAPLALARRVVRRAFALLHDDAPAAATVARVLDAPAGGGATLPGGISLHVERDWRTLVVTDPADVVTPQAPVRLDGGSRVVWHPAGLSLRVLGPDAVPDVGDQIALTLPGVWVPPRHRVDPRRVVPGTIGERYALALPASAYELWLRPFAPGDRIRGPGGTRRAADVLRDAGMPRALRSRWPMLVGDDRLLWIPGVAVDAELAAAARRAPALALHATPG